MVDGVNYGIEFDMFDISCNKRIIWMFNLNVVLLESLLDCLYLLSLYNCYSWINYGKYATCFLREIYMHWPELVLPCSRDWELVGDSMYLVELWNNYFVCVCWNKLLLCSGKFFFSLKRLKVLLCIFRCVYFDLSLIYRKVSNNLME